MAKSKRAVKTVEEAIVFEDESYTFSRKGPQRKRSGKEDGWVGIVETLYSEHRYISSLLNTLEQQANKLKPGKVPDYHLLLEIVDYLVHYPGQYHHPREDLLFTGLLKCDKKFQGRLERLQREHETLNLHNDRLYKQLTAIANGRPVDRPKLLLSLQRYIAGYKKHLEYESREIFPLAQGTLTAAALKKIDARTRYIDDPLFGNEVSLQYRRLGRDLQLRVGSLRENLIERELSVLESVLNNLSGLANNLGELSGSVCRQRKNSHQPSWQARVMNACTRTMLKPMMQYGSVESMRTMTGTFDERGEKNLPEDINAKKVRGPGYEGEWVRIAGKRTRKVILYFPGGGFIMRTATAHKVFVAKICRAANAKALVVHYSLAPEIPFPGGLEDCVAAYHDLLKQGHKPADITLAGDSAGGGLVLSTLLALRDEGTALPANAIVLSPLADLTYSGESRKFNKRKDPMLPTHRASEMHQLYIGDSLPEDRFISPIFADFDGLPPMLGLVGSTEILLDDTVRAAAQAEKAEVPFYLEVWEQMPHVFPIFGMLPESRVAIDRMGEFINHSELDVLPDEYGRHTGTAG
jgi:acetyl esterase/lipase/hemerythrin-like domain-containing protein